MDDRKKLEHQIALATRTAAYAKDKNCDLVFTFAG